MKTRDIVDDVESEMKEKAAIQEIIRNNVRLFMELNAPNDPIERIGYFKCLNEITKIQDEISDALYLVHPRGINGR